tara:strand:+ start:8852 stop:10642 length:1791 start_codon:yes stop_codon:yes gene_type:complete
MSKIKPSINYTSRDYTSIRADLESHVRRYYPDTFRDFSEASFGALMLDTVAYVGDVLSFYVDYQANESFLDTAMEFDNILKLSRELGYKYSPYPSSFGVCNFYITIPAETGSPEPDKNYMPILKKGSTFFSDNDTIFTLLEDVNFANSTNPIVVAEEDSNTGAPTSYAVRAAAQVISGELAVQEVNVGEYKPFLRIKISGQNISEISTVFDDSGNQYYEVDYLTQDTIYVPVLNRGAHSQTTPYILKPVSVGRRFRVENTPDGIFLQFGQGSDETPVEIKDPSEVALQLHGKDYVSDTSFDPSILNQTDKLGVVPSDTVLTIVYRINTTDNTNVAANSINRVGTADFDFPSSEQLDNGKISSVTNSLAVLNETPMTGDVGIVSANEIKERAKGNFAAQYRAVTKQDYISMAYNMPSKYGKLKRIALELDTDSYNQRNLNYYILAEDTNNFLVQANQTLKSNLKTWINQYKMINDTIDILDAKISNIGIEFVGTAFPGVNKYDLLNECNRILRAAFSRSFDIGEPILITDIYQVLKSVPDLMDVTKAKVVLREGSEYADSPVTIEESLSADGRFVIPPSDTVFEIKFPNRDIRGTIL